MNSWNLYITKAGELIYEIKKCENRECSITFIHRDKNATQNIEHIFKVDILGERPEKFTTEYYKQRRKWTANTGVAAEQAEQNRLMGAAAEQILTTGAAAGHDTLVVIYLV